MNKLVLVRVAVTAFALSVGVPRPVTADNKPSVKPTAVDCAALETAAKDSFGKSDYGNALKQADAAMKCSGEHSLSLIAALAACSISDAGQARFWGKLVPAQKQVTVRQRCIQNGVGLDGKTVASAQSKTAAPPPAKTAPNSNPNPAALPAKDCKALADEGRSSFSIGEYKAALDSLEAAMKCSPKLKLQRLAGMAACRANNLDRARYWVKRVSEPEASAIMQACEGRL